MMAVAGIARLVCSGLMLWLSTSAGQGVAPEPPLLPRVVTAQEVRALARAHAGELHYCHRQQLRRRPVATPDKVDVVVQLGDSGHVRRVEVVGENPQALTVCIRMFVKQWRFPGDAAPQPVRFPLLFAR